MPVLLWVLVVMLVVHCGPPLFYCLFLLLLDLVTCFLTVVAAVCNAELTAVGTVLALVMMMMKVVLLPLIPLFFIMLLFAPLNLLLLTLRWSW